MVWVFFSTEGWFRPHNGFKTGDGGAGRISASCVTPLVGGSKQLSVVQYFERGYRFGVVLEEGGGGGYEHLTWLRWWVPST